MDRLGRNPLVTRQASTDLANLGVALQSMTESIDNRTPHSRFSLVMLVGAKLKQAIWRAQALTFAAVVAATGATFPHHRRRWPITRSS